MKVSVNNQRPTTEVYYEIQKISGIRSIEVENV